LSEPSRHRPQVFGNLWAKEAGANTVPRPRCGCLEPQYGNVKWSELQIHSEEQDTACAGWQRLNELIDDAARDGREEFSPGPEMTPTQWTQITILPPSIARLKSVKHFILYGSSLVRIPPEIVSPSLVSIRDPAMQKLEAQHNQHASVIRKLHVQIAVPTVAANRSRLSPDTLQCLRFVPGKRHAKTIVDFASDWYGCGSSACACLFGRVRGESPDSASRLRSISAYRRA
jgi:hypothetical protein